MDVRVLGIIENNGKVLGYLICDNRNLKIGIMTKASLFDSVQSEGHTLVGSKIEGNNLVFLDGAESKMPVYTADKKPVRNTSKAIVLSVFKATKEYVLYYQNKFMKLPEEKLFQFYTSVKDKTGETPFYNITVDTVNKVIKSRDIEHPIPEYSEQATEKSEKSKKWGETEWSKSCNARHLEKLKDSFLANDNKFFDKYFPFIRCTTENGVVSYMTIRIVSCTDDVVKVTSKECRILYEEYLKVKHPELSKLYDMLFKTDFIEKHIQVGYNIPDEEVGKAKLLVCGDEMTDNARVILLWYIFMLCARINEKEDLSQRTNQYLRYTRSWKLFERFIGVFCSDMCDTCLKYISLTKKQADTLKVIAGYYSAVPVDKTYGIREIYFRGKLPWCASWHSNYKYVMYYTKPLLPIVIELLKNDYDIDFKDFEENVNSVLLRSRGITFTDLYKNQGIMDCSDYDTIKVGEIPFDTATGFAIMGYCIDKKDMSKMYTKGLYKSPLRYIFNDYFYANFEEVLRPYIRTFGDFWFSYRFFLLLLKPQGVYPWTYGTATLKAIEFVLFYIVSFTIAVYNPYLYICLTEIVKELSNMRFTTDINEDITEHRLLFNNYADVMKKIGKYVRDNAEIMDNLRSNTLYYNSGGRFTTEGEMKPYISSYRQAGIDYDFLIDFTEIALCPLEPKIKELHKKLRDTVKDYNSGFGTYFGKANIDNLRLQEIGQASEVMGSVKAVLDDCNADKLISKIIKDWNVYNYWDLLYFVNLANWGTILRE